MPTILTRLDIDYFLSRDSQLTKRLLDHESYTPLKLAKNFGLEADLIETFNTVFSGNLSENSDLETIAENLELLKARLTRRALRFKTKIYLGKSGDEQKAEKYFRKYLVYKHWLNGFYLPEIFNLTNDVIEIGINSDENRLFIIDLPAGYIYSDEYKNFCIDNIDKLKNLRYTKTIEKNDYLCYKLSKNRLNREFIDSVREQFRSYQNENFDKWYRLDGYTALQNLLTCLPGGQKRFNKIYRTRKRAGTIL